jgi:hypothetical protein
MQRPIDIHNRAPTLREKGTPAAQSERE